MTATAPTGRAPWIAAITVAAVLGALGGALAGGRLLSGNGSADDPSRSADGRAPSSLTSPATTGAVPDAGMEMDSARLAALAGGAEASIALLREENQRLLARVAELEKERATRGAADGSGKGPVFTFGEMGRLDAVVQADWPSLATASKAVSDALFEMYRRTQAGEPVPREVQIRLQENVERMRTYEYRTLDRMPTAAPHNGELTHPITETNLLARLLEQGGKPLSESQIAEFNRLGAQFEDDFARVRAAWGPAGAPTVARARRLLDEVRLKGKFTDALWATLTEEQRPLWVDPAYRGVAFLDLLDPTLMVINTSPVVTGAGVSDLRPKLLAMLRPKVGLKPDASDTRLEAAVDAFLARTGRGLAAVPATRARNYTFADAVAAGEATADLVDALLRDLELTADTRRALFDDGTWYVPRLIAS